MAAATIQTEKPPKFFHGTVVSYGHSLSAGSFTPIDRQYQPHWEHTITLKPELHFLDEKLFARGLMFISQEITSTYSTETNTPHEIQLSDAYIDVGTLGYTDEKYTGLNVAGSVRFTLPGSKLSQARTQWLNVGPGVALSRKFNLLSGLTLSYGVRGTFHFNQYTTARTQAGRLPDCDLRDEACGGFGQNAGPRNVFFDVSHGPSLSFQPTETVSIDMLYLMTRGWQYQLAPIPVQSEVTAQQDVNDSRVKDAARFMLSASWQFSKPIGISLTALTLTKQLGSDGQYHFTLFNRDTTVYLDASVDIEAVASKLF